VIWAILLLPVAYDIGGANALNEVYLDADQAMVLAAEIERTEVATTGLLDIHALAERITPEMSALQRVIAARAEIGAWTNLPKKVGSTFAPSERALLARSCWSA
jgi:hypothetical protein